MIGSDDYLVHNVIYGVAGGEVFGTADQIFSLRDPVLAQRLANKLLRAGADFALGLPKGRCRKGMG